MKKISFSFLSMHHPVSQLLLTENVDNDDLCPGLLIISLLYTELYYLLALSVYGGEKDGIG